MSSGILIDDTDRAAYTDLVQALERGGRSVRFRDVGDTGPEAALVLVDFEPESETGEERGPKRSVPVGTPFVAVAANDNPQAIRAAFARGALDVFVKPFSANEVAFKLERLLTTRQALSHRSNVQALPGRDAPTNLVLNETFLRVELGELPPVTLTPREFQILHLLYQAPGHSVTRPSVFAAVWSGLKVCQKVLDVHISKMRKKLKPLGLTINFVRPNHYVLVMEPLARG